MKEKSYLKTWPNNPNNVYVIGTDENKPRSREIAKKYIYDLHRDKYPRPFNSYVVHHINGKTLNDSPENLYICTQEEHNKIHREQIKNRKKFQSSLELDNFLKGPIAAPPIIIATSPNSGIQLPAKELLLVGLIGIVTLMLLVGINLIQENGSRLNSYNQTSITLTSVVQEPSQVIAPSPILSTQDLEELKAENQFIVNSTKTTIIINNHRNSSLSLNITYRISSHWFGIDKTTSQIFEVGPNAEQVFTVYDNDGCDSFPCFTEIISYQETSPNHNPFNTNY